MVCMDISNSHHSNSLICFVICRANHPLPSPPPSLKPLQTQILIQFGSIAFVAWTKVA